MSMPGLNTASKSNCDFSQLNSVFEIGHLIAASVQVLSLHTGEYFVSRLHCSQLVLCDWDSRQMIIQEILRLREQQLPGSSGYFFELIFF